MRIISQIRHFFSDFVRPKKSSGITVTVVKSTQNQTEAEKTAARLSEFLALDPEKHYLNKNLRPKAWKSRFLFWKIKTHGKDRIGDNKLITKLEDMQKVAETVKNGYFPIREENLKNSKIYQKAVADNALKIFQKIVKINPKTHYLDSKFEIKPLKKRVFFKVVYTDRTDEIKYFDLISKFEELGKKISAYSVKHNEGLNSKLDYQASSYFKKIKQNQFPNSERRQG